MASSDRLASTSSTREDLAAAHQPSPPPIAPRVDRIEFFALSHPLEPGTEYGSTKAWASARTATLVRLTTSDGVIGWGECYGPPEPVAALLRRLAEDLVGHPVDHIVGLVAKHLATQYHVASAGIYTAALSGVDMALWDAWGRTLGVSVARLLGGRLRDQLRGYASTGYSRNGDDLDGFRASIRDAADRGFDAVKIKVGFGAAADERRATIAREELGPDRRLIVDFNGNCTADLAVQSLERLAAFDLTWAEEPVPPDDFAGLEHIRRHTTVSLAGGETLCTRFGFRESISQHLFDIVQPDVSLCGGLTEAIAIAHLASASHVRVSPHVWGGAVGLAASLQFAATLSDSPFGRVVPEPLWFEWDQGENPLRDDLLKTKLRCQDGVVVIPDLPGFGIEVDAAAVAEFVISH